VGFVPSYLGCPEMGFVVISTKEVIFVPICFSNSRRVSIKFFKVVGLGLEMVS